jgi:phosphatidylinositol alpha-mannosyltransferase
VSKATAAELVRLRYADAGRIDVVPNPIDPATTLAQRHDRSGPLRVGFLGAPSSRKGFDLLPAVACGLDPARARLLVFARPYPNAPADVRRIWDELRRRDDLQIPGRLDDVREALSECDVLLCPSRQESFCRVAAEAMLNGIAVVASDLPAVREVVGADAGVLVPPGRPAPFVEAVHRLAGDPSLRRRLGEAGRRRAAAFAPPLVAQQLEDLYRAFSESGAAP